MNQQKNNNEKPFPLQTWERYPGTLYTEILLAFKNIYSNLFKPYSLMSFKRELASSFFWLFMLPMSLIGIMIQLILTPIVAIDVLLFRNFGKQWQQEELYFWGKEIFNTVLLIGASLIRVATLPLTYCIKIPFRLIVTAADTLQTWTEKPIIDNDRSFNTISLSRTDEPCSYIAGDSMALILSFLSIKEQAKIAHVSAGFYYATQTHVSGWIVGEFLIPNVLQQKRQITYMEIYHHSILRQETSFVRVFQSKEDASLYAQSHIREIAAPPIYRVNYFPNENESLSIMPQDAFKKLYKRVDKDNIHILKGNDVFFPGTNKYIFNPDEEDFRVDNLKNLMRPQTLKHW